MWDLIVTGGGSTGVSAAISASRSGCKTLLIEKMGFLGGTATAALVTPMMKNMLADGTNLSNGLYSELLARLSEIGHAATHGNGNSGWFDPELMKCVLDDLCVESNVTLLFDTQVISVETENNSISTITVHNKSGLTKLTSKFYIDTTGDADLASLAGVPFQYGENNNMHQAMSLRFNMANIDLEEFGKWIMEIDPDSGVSSVCYGENDQMLLHTAHTENMKDSKLKPYFDKAIQDGVIKPEDADYFQVFSIPGQKGSLAFNCPRIYTEKVLDPLNQWDLSYAQVMGRKQIRRIAEFCKKYLVGFKDAYISQIAPSLGIRESRRIEGLYKLTEEDIFNARKFDNTAAKSNYPVDIHSNEKGKSVLKELDENDYYEIPIESMIPVNINNLFVAGRSVSATFKAQASLRIQPNCWSMGEAAGKIVAQKLGYIS